jgi:hypothetical protein
MLNAAAVVAMPSPEKRWYRAASNSRQLRAVAAAGCSGANIPVARDVGDADTMKWAAKRHDPIRDHLV